MIRKSQSSLEFWGSCYHWGSSCCLVECRKQRPSSSSLPHALTWQKALGMDLPELDLCLSQQAQHVGDTRIGSGGYLDLGKRMVMGLFASRLVKHNFRAPHGRTRLGSASDVVPALMSCVCPGLTSVGRSHYPQPIQSLSLPVEIPGYK